MGKSGNKKGASLIPKTAALKKNDKQYLNKNITQLDGWKNNDSNANILVSLRYVQNSFECFSSWSRDEMNLFWDFQERISNCTWREVYSTASKGAGKTGFAYTVTQKSDYSVVKSHGGLSADITLFELRLSEQARVHGFRHNALFYILWLDKDHRVFKQ